MISAGGLSTRRRSCRTSHPTARPTPTPPTTLTTNNPPACAAENDPETTATTATRYATSPVPSLTRLSPSTIVTSLRGTPRRRAIEVAARGSVGETIAPSTNALPHESPSTNVWATTATPTVVATTRPTASAVIGRALVRRSRSEVKKAAP